MRSHVSLASQPYFSSVCMRVREGGVLSPAPLPNAHAHEEKYDWLARLESCNNKPMYIYGYMLSKSEL